MRRVDEKYETIKVARELPYITEDDIKFFMQKETTLVQIQNRMIKRRNEW